MSGPTEGMILIIAKNIEIGGEKYVIYGGKPGIWFTRDGVEKELEEIWNDLSEEQKEVRINQAHGAWFGITQIGVDIVFQQTFNEYLSEK